MKRVVVDHFGGPEVLRVVEEDDPRPGQIHPIVAERVPLTDARHAHELLESTAAKGKLVLVP